MQQVHVHDGLRRTTVSTGSPWESRVGYSRAVKARGMIAVTGTVGIMADGTFPPSTAEQARQAIRIIESALMALGAGLGDVIRTRIFVTDISQWEAIGAVHAEFFGQVRPATTMVEVSKLIDPRATIEIEADAIDPASSD